MTAPAMDSLLAVITRTVMTADSQQAAAKVKAALSLDSSCHGADAFSLVESRLGFKISF